jgi:hypothetical protein
MEMDGDENGMMPGRSGSQPHRQLHFPDSPEKPTCGITWICKLKSSLVHEESN